MYAIEKKKKKNYTKFSDSRISRNTKIIIQAACRTFFGKNPKKKKNDFNIITR